MFNKQKLTRMIDFTIVCT